MNLFILTGVLILTPLGCTLVGWILGYFGAQYLTRGAKRPDVQSTVMIQLTLLTAGLGGLLGLIIDVGLLIKRW